MIPLVGTLENRTLIVRRRRRQLYRHAERRNGDLYAQKECKAMIFAFCINGVRLLVVPAVGHTGGARRPLGYETS